MGPLPPSQPDCCILSKINEIKAANGVKSKRPSKRNRCRVQPRDRSDSITETSAKDMTPSATTCGSSCGGGSSSLGEAPPIDHGATSALARSMPRLLSALTEPRKPYMANSTNLLPLSPPIQTQSPIILDDEPMPEPRSNSRKSSVSSKLGDNIPLAIPNKKKAILLDAFGKPRKSPREHASTLAILSNIVQQRRKRFKELNGGISPEKMPNYLHTNGTMADLTDDDDCDNDSGANTDNGDHFDTNSRGSDSNSKHMADRNSDAVHSSEAEGDSASERIGGHKFLLRKGLRRQLSGLAAATNDDCSKTASRKATPIPMDDNDDDDNQKEIKYPKLPVDDYVDPNVVARELDAVLNECFDEVTNDLKDFELAYDEHKEPSDLVLVNTPKDFVEIVTTVREGPLTYRYMNTASSNNSGLSSFMKGKKRRNNKTGWPSIPKRRTMIKREKRNSSAAIATDDVGNSDDDATVNATIAGETDRVDISSHLLQNKVKEYLIHSSRQHRPSASSQGDGEQTTINTNTLAVKDEYEFEEDDDLCVVPYLNTNDNAINNVFTSSSEKAENSDIFTVSSDSRDTADTAAADRAGSRTVLSHSNTNKDDESINGTDEDDDTTEPTKRNVMPRKMETRGKERMNNILSKHNNRLQPVVCVKKICEKDLYRRTYGRSTSKSPQKAKESPTKQLALGSTNARSSCSPRGKTSPRKLRKPRGRYYKER